MSQSPLHSLFIPCCDAIAFCHCEDSSNENPFHAMDEWISLTSFDLDHQEEQIFVNGN